MDPLANDGEGTGRKQKGVLIMDGVITHCGWRLVLWCYENNLELVLRPPNTTSMSQPEDVILFKTFKTEWCHFKDERLRFRIDCAMLHKVKGGVFISWNDVTEGVKFAHDKAFQVQYFQSAWGAVGVRPFNRFVEKRLRMKEGKAEQRRLQKKGVKEISLSKVMELVNMPDSEMATLNHNNTGRGMAGRIRWGQPLTHEEAVATRGAEETAKRLVVEEALRKRAATEAGFKRRGEAASSVLAEAKGDTKGMSVDQLRDFLRHEGVPAAECKGNKGQLMALMQSRFVVGDFDLDPDRVQGDGATEVTPPSFPFFLSLNSFLFISLYFSFFFPPGHNGCQALGSAMIFNFVSTPESISSSSYHIFNPPPPLPSPLSLSPPPPLSTIFWFYMIS
jgi:hypothetical protein